MSSPPTTCPDSSSKRSLAAHSRDEDELTPSLRRALDQFVALTPFIEMDSAPGGRSCARHRPTDRMDNTNREVVASGVELFADRRMFITIAGIVVAVGLGFACGWICLARTSSDSSPPTIGTHAGQVADEGTTARLSERFNESPFLLRRSGQVNQRFASLQSAFDSTQPGDTITVSANGTFRIPRIEIQTPNVKLQAAPGVLPVFEPASSESDMNLVLFDSDFGIELAGLDIRDPHGITSSLIGFRSGTLRLTNCRLTCKNKASPGTAILWDRGGLTEVAIEDSRIIAGSALRIHQSDTADFSAALTLLDNVVLAHRILEFHIGFSDEERIDQPSSALQVTAESNVFVWSDSFVDLADRPRSMTASAGAFRSDRKQWLTSLLTWSESRNAYNKAEATASYIEVRGRATLSWLPDDKDEWLSFWPAAR